MGDEVVRDVTGGEAAFPIDLGHGLRLREAPAGFELRHLCKTGNGDRPTDFRIWNAPIVDVVNPGHHTLVSREPLTIRPSISCPPCGLHGWITDGTWRPC